MKLQLDELLTIRQTAKILHVHPNTLRRWGQKGLLGVWHICPRGDRRFSKKEVMIILDKMHI